MHTESEDHFGGSLLASPPPPPPPLRQCPVSAALQTLGWLAEGFESPQVQICVMASCFLCGVNLGIDQVTESVLFPAAEPSLCPKTFLLTRGLLSYFEEIHMDY